MNLEHIIKRSGNIYEQQKINHRLSVILVSIFILYYLLLGYGIDVFVLKSDPLGFIRKPDNSFPYATIVAILVAAVYAIHCYYNGDNIVLESVNSGSDVDDSLWAGIIKRSWVVLIIVPLFIAVLVPIIMSFMIFGRADNLIVPKKDELGFIHHMLGYTPFVMFGVFFLALGVCAIYYYLTRDDSSYGYSDEQPVILIRKENQRYRQLINVVSEISIAAGIPVPSMYLVRDADPNVFATGRDPRHACIVLTTGLVEKLDREEIQAAVAHAVAHIRNHDTRLLTLLVTLGTGSVLLVTSAGALLSQRLGGITFFVRLIILVPGLVIFLPLWLSLMFFTSLTVRALELLITDERIYQADVTAMELTRNPEGMVRALTDIDFFLGPTRSFKAAIGPLCIVGPSGEFERMDNATFTYRLCMKAHPPMAKRIEAVKAMGYMLKSDLHYSDRQEKPVV